MTGWLIKKLLDWFRRENPPLSFTEQQVINSGGKWWGDEIFAGKPNWQAFISTEITSLSAQEKSFLLNEVSAFCDLLDEWKISYQDHDLSPQAWAFLKKHKLWAIGIDPRYGGLGFSTLAHAAIINKISTSSVSAAITVMVPNALGPGIFISQYGTEEQKNYYLPRLTGGEEIPCFALTGIESGSDAASINDIGIVEYSLFAGKKILGIRLNWNKRYITLAPICTLLGLAFRLLDPDHLLGAQTDIGITLAVVPAHLPGVEQGSRHFSMNLGFMNGPSCGQDVFIPLDYVIGGPAYYGRGWQMMMECLVIGRGISVPNLAAGVIQTCWRLSTAYASIRQQFNRPIIKFEGVQQKLAEMSGIAYLTEAVRHCMAEAINEGSRPAVLSALTKYHLTELARNQVSMAMDIHAGQAIQLGAKNYMSLLHQIVPVMITVEGANILTRGLIIYGQGLMRGHPFLAQELQAAMSMDVKSFKRLFFRHMIFFIKQSLSVFFHGMTRGFFMFKGIPHFERKYFRYLSRMSKGFAVANDFTLMILGKKLKIRETLSGRMGDILSHIYMASAVLKYFYQNKHSSNEKPFMDWTVLYCFENIQKAWMDFLNNFPNRFVAKLLKLLIFPWGVPYLYAKDKLESAMILSIQEDRELKNKISPYAYFSHGGAAWKMEQALEKINQVGPLLERLTQVKEVTLSQKVELAYQKNLINDDEREQLNQVVALYWDAIQSDAFMDLSKL